MITKHWKAFWTYLPPKHEKSTSWEAFKKELIRDKKINAPGNHKASAKRDIGKLPGGLVLVVIDKVDNLPTNPHPAGYKTLVNNDL